MATMNVIDVCGYLYPGQLELGNIVFGMNSDGTFFINAWTVPDIEQPTIEYLESQIPVYQQQFDIAYFKSIDMILLKAYVNAVPTQRKYDSELACASYINSTIVQWQEEAIAFLAWRDNVFLYTIEQIALMEADERTVPSFDDFKTELPPIIWP